MFKKSETKKLARRALVLVDELESTKSAEERQEVYKKLNAVIEDIYRKLGKYERAVAFARMRTELKKMI